MHKSMSVETKEWLLLYISKADRSVESICVILLKLAFQQEVKIDELII